MREIFLSHSVTTLKKEISKTNIKGYSTMKKAQIVDLMVKNQARFSHIKLNEKKKLIKKKTEPRKKIAMTTFQPPKKKQRLIVKKKPTPKNDTEPPRPPPPPAPKPKASPEPKSRKDVLRDKIRLDPSYPDYEKEYTELLRLFAMDKYKKGDSYNKRGNPVMTINSFGKTSFVLKTKEGKTKRAQYRFDDSVVAKTQGFIYR